MKKSKNTVYIPDCGRIIGIDPYTHIFCLSVDKENNLNLPLLSDKKENTNLAEKNLLVRNNNTKNALKPENENVSKKKRKAPPVV